MEYSKSKLVTVVATYKALINSVISPGCSRQVLGLVNSSGFPT